MALSGVSHGKNLEFSIDTQGGVLKDVTSYVRSVDGLAGEVELGDVTAAGDEGYNYIQGLQKADFTIEGVFDDAVDSLWDVVKDFMSDTDTRSFELYPAGSTSGYVKISGECRIKKVTIPTKSTDPLTLTIECAVDGTITIGTAS